MKELLLCGPFVGSLSHEYKFFSSHVMWLKMNRPDLKLAVFTRPERFDLYGEYANYLIPLRIENDKEKDQIFYKSKIIHIDDYELMIKKIYLMYSKRFDTIHHIYPNIKNFFYKVKYQFQRNQVLYDLQPRKENILVVNNLLKNKSPILIILPKNNQELFGEINKIIQKNTNLLFMQSQFNQRDKPVLSQNKLINNYLFITDCDLSEKFYYNINNLKIIENETSTIGYLIEIIKKSKFVIAPKGDITNLSLLLKIPTIIIGKKSKIFNPLNTENIFCEENKILNLISNKLSDLVKPKNNFNCI